MPDSIRIDTDCMQAVAAQLNKLVKELQSISLPSADGIGNGTITASLQDQRNRLVILAEHTQTLEQSVHKAAQMHAECEKGLTKTSNAVIESDRILWGMPTDSAIIGIQSKAIIAYVLLTLRIQMDGAKLYSAFQNIVRFFNQDGAFSTKTNPGRQAACEAQRKLAMGIYDGFTNGKIASTLRQQGFDTVTIQHPSGIAAYRTGADGVPEIQIIYRGTTTDEDKLVDGAVAINADGFHTGFADSTTRFLNTLRDQPVSDEAQSPTYGQILNAATQGQPVRITVTGHSLGAAEAQLTVASMLKSGIPAQNVTGYTFASPVVATQEAIGQSYLKDAQIYNIVNLRDEWVTNAGAGGTRFLVNAGNLGFTYGYVDSSLWSNPISEHTQGYGSIPYDTLGKI